MRLGNGWHLAYCTNIHRGETWAEVFGALRTHTLAVRDRVSGGAPYAIGLRLGSRAAAELSEPAVLGEFRRWLDRENCYVFTVNGFPYGTFHGTRVKEQVYRPDWTSSERVDYTKRLFDLLAQLAPVGVSASVSTVPGSFKSFIRDRETDEAAMRRNLWSCVEHAAALSERDGREYHLGLEPEPLCYLETTGEVVEFFDRLRDDRPGDGRLERHLGVNYDTCHLACEFEEPGEALGRLWAHGIRLSKLHLSSALKVDPRSEVRAALGRFVDAVYFHQVIARERGTGRIRRVEDLDVALAEAGSGELDEEWRIHFHVPLHQAPDRLFGTTSDHVIGVLDALAREPGRVEHLEMETYTWEVLPEGMRERNVVDQLVAEYGWTLEALRSRGVVEMGSGAWKAGDVRGGRETG